MWWGLVRQFARVVDFFAILFEELFVRDGHYIFGRDSRQRKEGRFGPRHTVLPRERRTDTRGGRGDYPTLTTSIPTRGLRKSRKETSHPSFTPGPLTQSRACSGETFNVSGEFHSSKNTFIVLCALFGFVARSR
jgi:hypothetical protein